MEIKEALIRSISEVFPIFKMKPIFQGEEENAFLSSADPVNVLSSFAHALEGNIVFGFTRPQALQIATLATGQGIGSLDIDAKNAICDITSLVVNLAVSKYQAVNSIYISPPVFITGDDIFVMISRTKSTRLNFQLNLGILAISYSIERKW